MTPTFAAALLRALQAGRNLGPRGMPVTEERATAVLDVGWIEVNGRRIPVTGHGARGLRAGAKVAVAWQRGQPTVAIRHSARRTGAVGPQPQLGGVVEELFIALDPDSGQVDVWFRNDQQVTNLGLRASMDADPVYVKWGTRSDAFIVATAAHHYYICTLGRTEDTVLGSASAAASIERDEQPLEQNYPLLNAHNEFTLSGETKYWVFTPPVGPGDGTLTEGASNPISRSGSETGIIYLTRLLIEGLTVGSTSARALITDIHLDDALNLIWLLSVQLTGANGNSSASIPPIVPAGALPTFTHPIQKNDGSGSLQYDTGDDMLSVDVGQHSTHIILINVTTGAILFKTCKDTIVHSVTTEITRLHTGKRMQAPLLGNVEDFCPGDMGKGGAGFSWGSSSGPPYAFQYTGLVCSSAGFFGPELTAPGVTAYSFEDFDPAKVPYLDLSDIFGEEHTPLVFENGVGVHSVKFTFDARLIHHRKRYWLSAVYLPRRAPSPNAAVPLGMLLVKAELTYSQFFTIGGSTPGDGTYQGFFLHDLQNDTVTTLAPMEFNAYLTQINHASVGLFAVRQPETNGAFVVLGFNGTHLLWWHGSRASAVSERLVDIKLTQVETGVTVTVLSGFSEVESADQALLDFVVQNFQVLRPDFFYYPSETDEAGNNFVEAWNAQGVPTLDATAPGFPEINAELERFASLFDLGEGIVPNEDTIITRNGQPLNIEDMTQTGPSWHVVQDAQLISGSLTPDP